VQYDELLEFTVKLTAESEHLKEESKVLQEKYKRTVQENERLRQTAEEAKRHLEEPKRAQPESELRRRVNAPQSSSGEKANSFSHEEEHEGGIRRSFRVEIWQACVGAILVFLMGYYFS